MNNRKRFLVTLAKASSIVINICVITLLVFFASLYVVDSRMATNLGRSCVSCKKPNVIIAGPRVLDGRGRLRMRDWRVVITPAVSEPVVVPELRPSEQQKIAIAKVNHYRDLVAVKPVTLNKEINGAAEAHASYNVQHNLSGHTEEQQKSGFSGIWPWDRMRHFGYDTFSYATEVCSTRWAAADYLLSIDPKWAVNGWVDTVYHRIPIISPDVYEMGFGAHKAGGRVAYVMDFGNPGFPEEKRVITYPVDRQKDVPVEFTGDEKPDPLPGVRYPVGYPITVTFNGYKEISIKRIRLTGSDGAGVRFYELRPYSDKHIRDSLAIIPKESLDYGATYYVSVSGIADGKQIDLSWNFTTTKTVRGIFP